MTDTESEDTEYPPICHECGGVIDDEWGFIRFHARQIDEILSTLQDTLSEHLAPRFDKLLLRAFVHVEEIIEISENNLEKE